MRLPVLLGSRFTRFAAPALAGATLLGGVLAQAPAAHADFLWCWDDPVVAINGQQVTIKDALFTDAGTISTYVKNSTLTIHVPKGVTTKVVATNNPYYKELVIFVADNGTWTKGQAVPVTVALTYNLNSGAPSLQAQMTTTTPSTSYAASGTDMAGTAQSFTLQ